MIFSKTIIEGVYIIEPELKEDERGYFTRMFCQNELANKGITFPIAQINQVQTKRRGTIRGPHIQTFPYHEGKIVQCLQGSIFDVAIDFRKDSSTFGQWIGTEISFENRKTMLIPKGFLHGYQTLEDNTIIQYSVSEYYHPESVSGIRWDDPFFNIQWPIKKVITSPIDKSWPLYKDK